MSTPLILVIEAMRFRSDMVSQFGTAMVDDGMAGRITGSNVSSYGGLTKVLDMASKAVAFGQAMVTEHGEATVQSFLALSPTEREALMPKMGACPPIIAAEAKAIHNIDLATALPPDVQDKAAAAGLDWQKILDLLKTYGPVVLQIIISIFGGAPTPPAP